MEKQDEIIAYKAFFKGLKNNLDNVDYQVGMKYVSKDKLQYMKGGFHMCEQPEDCFRFLRPSQADVDLTLVRGYGHMYGFDAGFRAYDDTIGDIYICEKMEILKVYTREEIINMTLEMSPIRLEVFLSLYPLTPEEAEYIKFNYPGKTIYNIYTGAHSVSEVVDHYQKQFIKRREDYHE